MRTSSKAALLGGGVVLAAWTAWGIYSTRSAESVPYERIRALDGVELRRYPATVRVETTAPDQITAFRRLFRYITGANERAESIAMTAPVATDGGESLPMTVPVRSGSSEDDGDTYRMAFYLPDEYGLETAPAPADPAVRLVGEPPRTLAVTQFSWYAPAWRVERRERALRTTLDDAGVATRGDPFLLRYNDPWTPPFLRRNEVAVEVIDRGSTG
ncbi:MAG: SOUL family heme-binding protein [Halobacteriota archaeon]